MERVFTCLHEVGLSNMHLLFCTNYDCVMCVCVFALITVALYNVCLCICTNERCAMCLMNALISVVK